MSLKAHATLPAAVSRRVALLLAKNLTSLANMPWKNCSKASSPSAFFSAVKCVSVVPVNGRATAHRPFHLGSVRSL